MRSIALPIKKMTLSQKMDVIQRVWDSLIEKDSPSISPTWHRDVVEQRRESVKKGLKRMIPLADFKIRLKKELNAN